MRSQSLQETRVGRERAFAVAKRRNPRVDLASDGHFIGDGSRAAASIPAGGGACVAVVGGVEVTDAGWFRSRKSFSRISSGSARWRERLVLLGYGLIPDKQSSVFNCRRASMVLAGRVIDHLGKGILDAPSRSICAELHSGHMN